MTQANQEQATLWNERSGPVWVAAQAELDAQLEPFGRAVADRLALTSGEGVLDVGCGSGATSLMLAERAKPGHVLGVDISVPLVTRARERARNVGNVRFEVADAQTFSFEKGAFHCAFSRFGVMFFADPIAAFANLRGALRPGGRLGFVCWRPMRENPAFYLPLDAGLPFLPSPPAMPEPGAPGPFGFEDGERVRGILEAAGWTEVDVTPHDSEIVFGGGPNIEAAVDLALKLGPLSRALSELSPADLPRVRAAVRDAFAPHHGAAGVTLPSATWIVTAKTPG
jgi:SAM-dependent methyltransferase